MRTRAGVAELVYAMDSKPIAARLEGSSPSPGTMADRRSIVAVVGPTASGKSARAVALALERNGEVISVDSRQVYRTLDIGTEKISAEEMQGVPHYLIDIREPEEMYSAGNFVRDAEYLIGDISARGKLPILAGGTHFYFDALLNGLPEDAPANTELRRHLESHTPEELHAKLLAEDPEYADAVDPKNKRRLIRALELVSAFGSVPPRRPKAAYDVEWILIDPERDVLRERIETRLAAAFKRGLIDEVGTLRARLISSLGEPAADTRLNEFGLEYRVVGEYLRGERNEDSLLPTLSAKLWQYARHQKKWLRKLVPTT